MVGVKLLLLSLVFFFQGIYSFCIWNELADGSSFKITHANSCVESNKVFKKHMELGHKFCCPYENRDCSCQLRNYDEARFYVEFYFADGKNPPLKLVKCKTGGGLTIYGTREEYFAECVDENEVSTIVPIDDVAPP